MGVDGWGRPYDVAARCQDIGADLYVLQESWASDDGSPSTAARIAERLGHQVVAEVALSRGRLFAPHPEAGQRWGPPLLRPGKTLRLDGEHWTSSKEPDGRGFDRGQWGIALVSAAAGPGRGGHLPRPAPAGLGPAGGDPRRARPRGGPDRPPRNPHGPHHPRVPRPVPAAGHQASPGDRGRRPGRGHEPVGTPGHLVRTGVAASGHRPDLAGAPPAQPARPHRGHPAGAGDRGPHRRVPGIGPPTGDGHPGRVPGRARSATLPAPVPYRRGR